MIHKPHLESIKATIVSYTPVSELEKYIPEFCAITWMKKIEDIDQFLKSRNLTRFEVVREMFEFRTLPTALETVKVTFFLEGLDLTNVTHVIRHRLFSYSAQSTDPVSMEDHDILTNAAFNKYPDLAKRAHDLSEQMNELYKDALKRGLSYYDARHYQPRAKEAKYFMSGNIKEFIMFIKTRLGRQNQPTSDNIIALRMRQALLKAYPEVSDILEKHLPVEAIQYHYINAINHKMNLNTFPPDRLHYRYLADSCIEIGSKVSFSHPKPRDHYDTSEDFENLFSDIIKGDR